jgi:hypothetical protein
VRWRSRLLSLLGPICRQIVAKDWLFRVDLERYTAWIERLRYRLNPGVW